MGTQLLKNESLFDKWILFFICFIITVVPAFAQNSTIRGPVTGGVNKNVIGNASVVIKKGGNGARVDDNGNYELKVNGESLFKKFNVQSRVGLCLEALRKEFVSL